MTESDLMTLPISPRVFWGLVWMLGLLTASVVIYFALPTKPQGDTAWVRFKKDTGLIKVPEPLPELILLIWVTILALLIAGLGWNIARTAFGVIPADEVGTTVLFRLAGLTGVTGAVVAFPFTILRTQYNKRQTDAAEAALQYNNRQTDAAEAALVNDKLNAAFAGLSARRTITHRVATDSGEQIITEKEDDIIARSIAIDRLEGLAIEEPDQVARIVSILSIYVRELSREYPAKELPDNLTKPDDIHDWAQSLQPVRPDMEKAARTLGQLPDLLVPYDPKIIQPDLRSCNLQGFDLTRLNFDHAKMSEAKMQGANLFNAKMQGADLSGAKMQGADLSSAAMQGANLSRAKMQGADLSSAEMQGTDLSRAKMRGVDLYRAEMQEADLSIAEMQGAQLSFAKMQGADLTIATLRGTFVKFTDFTKTAVSSEQWKEMLGDRTTTLPAGTPYPDHWPDFEMNWSDFYKEWHRFKEDPAAYTPPDPPKDAPET